MIAENYRTDPPLVVHLGIELLSETIVDNQPNTHGESGGELRRMPVDNDEKPNLPFAKAVQGSVERDDGRVGPGAVRSDEGKHDGDTAPEGSGVKMGVPTAYGVERGSLVEKVSDAGHDCGATP